MCIFLLVGVILTAETLTQKCSIMAQTKQKYISCSYDDPELFQEINGSLARISGDVQGHLAEMQRAQRNVHIISDGQAWKQISFLWLELSSVVTPHCKGAQKCSLVLCPGGRGNGFVEQLAIVILFYPVIQFQKSILRVP